MQQHAAKYGNIWQHLAAISFNIQRVEHRVTGERNCRLSSSMARVLQKVAAKSDKIQNFLSF